MHNGVRRGKAAPDEACLLMWMSVATLIVMRTVQMTLDETLVDAVDKAARRLGLSRSAFTRAALSAALRKQALGELERRHREGYERAPKRKGELDGWDNEQVWPE